MFSYEEFCQAVVEQLPGYLTQYDIENIELNKVTKNNDIEMTGVVILREGETLAPNIHLDLFYEFYRVGYFTLDNVCKAIVNEYERAYESIAENKFSYALNDFESVKDKLFIKLINHEANKEVLKNAVYEKHMDLAACVRVLARFDEDGIGSTVYDLGLLEKHGVSKSEVIRIAFENTRKLFRPEIKNIFEVLENSGDYFATGNAPLYVLTNEYGINGAANMLYTDILDEFAQGNNMVIIPSSIHDVILMKDSDAKDMCSLRELVKHVNATIVSKSEFLSNNIYKFDAKTKQLSIADNEKELNQDDKLRD
ncbi:MAG: hypothetical protein IJZ96_00140 [Lachnospiraceae bacterium]|nr:hypothetical protein [Lachnospiraceae bacterium]MBQ8319029.1 hypothetical protein [Lachnospiraceae bacterium]